MWNPITIVNKMLEAKRNGDIVAVKIWQHRLEELQYIW